MFSREFRPLRRPKLGVPDYYPQEEKQKEDDLTYHSLSLGYRYKANVDLPDEVGSALKDFTQHLLTTKEYSARITQILDVKKRNGWVQDSQKRKLAVSKDSFFPVPLGRNRKEIATQWFQDLAGSKPLSTLVVRKLPVFNKKEEIFDNLCEKDVPVFRAVWYIKMTAAYNSTMTDSKLNKKKQFADPSFDWTVSITKYMQECVWRISNDASLLGRPDGRHPSSSGAQSLSEEGLAELHRWQYMVHLSCSLYKEDLLDCHEFLRWLVERVDQVKPKDTKSLQLYLPIVLRHLLDIADCVWLARPLVNFSCQKLAYLYDLDQKLGKFQPTLPTPGSAAKIDTDPHPETKETAVSEEDKDSVFNNPASSKPIKPEPQDKPDAKTPTISPSPASKEENKAASKPSSAAISKEKSPVAADSQREDERVSYFHWCQHHSSLMLQLSCILQTIAIRCPTALVSMRSIGRGASGNKGAPPLTISPVGLTELPLPATIRQELQKKLLPALAAVEQEIQQRNKSAESGWSSMTVADLQTTSEGSNVQKVLKILQVVDNHTFSSCRGHNPLTTLYCRISAAQKAAEVPLSGAMLAMLLCQWAVTRDRAGDHRPLVAARLLYQRQSEMMKNEAWRDDHDQTALDDSWEESTTPPSREIPDFPFQAVLVKFLDNRAPLPEDLTTPLRSTDPFFRLTVLFSELIRLGVFSYSSYLSTLIARGETKSPIIPRLPFARDHDGIKREAVDTGQLSLTISLPKKPRLDPEASFRKPQPSAAGGPSAGEGPLLSSGMTDSSTFGQDFSSFNFMSGEDPGSPLHSIFRKDGGAPVTDVLQERAIKLEKLLVADSIDPIGLEGPSSPMNQTKSDPFNFSLSFPAAAPESLFLEDDQADDVAINKQASRHLLFAAYFPIFCSKPELNERAVVLCGVGKSRNKVDRIVKKITVDIEHYFRLLPGISTPILPDSKLQDLMRRFRVLPTFEQRNLAMTCVKSLRSSLHRAGKGSGGQVSHFPACAQLVFVCELLEISGGIQQILDLLVDIIACDRAREKGEGLEVHRPPPSLPADLCLPVVWLLQKYFSCLLLSQQDTTVVFEGLCRVLDGLHNPAEITSAQKTVFLFLHRLYTNCSYLQRTYRKLFGQYCIWLGEHPGILSESYPPTNADSGWQRTIILAFLSKPGQCSIPQVCSYIKNNGFPKTVFIFVVDVFSSACQKNISCQTLCDLAHVCAEVCCACGPTVNLDLMGAFRALCLPSSIMKSCNTGFTQLTNRTNILMDPGIHSNLVTFVALLVANSCLLLHDIIVYIIKPIVRVQLMHPQGSSQSNSLSLEFVSSLVLHLLVDDYIQGDHTPSSGLTPGLDHSVRLPPFVRHCLQAKCRELDFNYIISLLKDLLRISPPSTREERIGVNTGMQILVRSASEGSESVLTKVRDTLEILASQDWVREKCIQHSARLLDSDKLGDTSLTPPQARYLLNLLSPYVASGVAADPQSHPAPGPPMHMVLQDAAVEHILKNLDQWTLRNALLHINVHIVNAAPAQVRINLLEHLASQVIQVFEDSCGDEWLGQIECCVESGDGAYSPPVWLVTPLISDLQQTVLGRVLKSAGNVLGQGQWWNPEKSQEKRRSTRATSGVAQPKTGLQWQQPFLELVLVCMHAQSTTHEELLGPLKTQLSTFISAFEKEGMPSDEQSKTMLHAALKLRVSLVGAMLSSISVSEAATLEWVPLFMQLLCSGAVDRQTDSSELFTNCLDMLSTLLYSLPVDFHTCLAAGGEDGRKTHTACIKKLKAELGSAKSACLSEIQQLFPLSQKTFRVITMKPPILMQPKGQNTGERIKGVRVQDSKEISPWDILAGTKNSGPLMLSWFGAIRTKRKPLTYEEQRKLVRFHTHQNRLQDMMYKTHYVSLPDLTPVVTEEETIDEPAAIPADEKAPGKEGLPPDSSKLLVSQTAGHATGAQRATQGGQGMSRSMANRDNIMAQYTGSFQLPTHPQHMRGAPMPPGHVAMGRGGISQMYMQPPRMGVAVRGPGAAPGMGHMATHNPESMKSTLQQIRQQQLLKNQQIGGGGGMPAQVPQGMIRFPRQAAPPPPPMYPGNVPQQSGPMLVRGPGQPMPGYTPQQQKQMRIQEAWQRMTPEQRTGFLQRQRILKAQQMQRVAAMGGHGQVMAPQYAPQPRPLYQQQMRPMQATPPMPMHAQQVVQPGFRPAAPQQQHMMMRPPSQQPLQYQQPGGMNPMHGQSRMF